MILMPDRGVAYTQNDAQHLTRDIRRSGGFQASEVIFISQDKLAEKIVRKSQKKLSFELVDLRLEVDYQGGHIPGALNIPLKTLRFLAEQMLAKSDDVVFYGYCRNDAASVNAVVLLVNKGFERVSLLEGGIEEWKGLRE